MSVSAFNRRWAAVILEALTRHGVQHICIAPGSRSTPLTLAAAENRAFIHHTHFVERGLGHLALGLAKASRQPVAVTRSNRPRIHVPKRLEDMANSEKREYVLGRNPSQADFSPSPSETITPLAFNGNPEDS